MRLSKILVLGILLGASTCLADTIHLKTGQTLQGDVKKSDQGYIVILPDGQRLEYKSTEIDSIEVGTRPTGQAPTDELAQGRLNSLRQGLENIKDPAQAIERYKQFLQQYADTGVIDQAKTDMALWQDRLDRKLVRIGTKWVTPQERDKLQQESLVTLSEARQLIKDGRSNEARPLLDKILQIDADNVSARYLRGLLQFQSNQIVDARKSFEAVNAATANHGPTLNNLAVLASRQNALPAAMDYYDKAMTASPLDLTILANVAEALNAVPKDKQNSSIVQRTYKRFIEQDRQLKPIMARKDMFRWGSNYIPKSQYDRYQQEATQVQAQLDALAGEFQSVQDRIKKIDQQGDENDRAMRQLEASRWYRDTDGKLIHVPLPPVYTELQIDNDKLKSERRDAVARLDQLRQQADATKRQIPSPSYTGVQTMIGIEGTPAILNVTISAPASGPTTGPATNPAPATDPLPVPSPVPPPTLPAGPTTSPMIEPAAEPGDIPEPINLNPMFPPSTMPATTLPADFQLTRPTTIPSTQHLVE